MDSIGILNLLKLVHMGGMNDLNTRHNKAMAHINLLNLNQERYQSIQDFRDQSLATKKVCDVLELCLQRCENHTLAIIKEEGDTNHTTQERH